MNNWKITIVLIATSLFVGCNINSRKTDNLNDVTPQTSMDTRKGDPVTMYMEQHTYPLGTEQVQVSVVNNSEEEVFTGEQYTIYRYKDENWLQLPLELFFIDIAYIIGAGESRDFTISLHTNMYDYEKGHYRIEKNIGGELFAAEFELE